MLLNLALKFTDQPFCPLSPCLHCLTVPHPMLAGISCIKVNIPALKLGSCILTTLLFPLNQNQSVKHPPWLISHSVAIPACVSNTSTGKNASVTLFLASSVNQQTDLLLRYNPFSLMSSESDPELKKPKRNSKFQLYGFMASSNSLLSLHSANNLSIFHQEVNQINPGHEDLRSRSFV